MTTPGRLMTRRQVAEHLAIGERAVDKLREDGTLGDLGGERPGHELGLLLSSARRRMR